MKLVLVNLFNRGEIYDTDNLDGYKPKKFINFDKAKLERLKFDKEKLEKFTKNFGDKES